MGRYSMTWLVPLVRISKDKKQGVSRYVLVSGNFGDEFLAHSDCGQNSIPCIGRTEFLVSLLARNCEILPDPRVLSRSMAHDPLNSIPGFSPFHVSNPSEQPSASSLLSVLSHPPDCCPSSSNQKGAMWLHWTHLENSRTSPYFKVS